MPTESLSNREWLPGEVLSGSKHRRPGWFIDMFWRQFVAGYPEVTWGVDGSGQVFEVLRFCCSESRGKMVSGLDVLGPGTVRV